MHPALGFQVAVRVVTGHQHGDALDARFVAGLDVHQIDLEAARFAVTLVHAQEHVRPITALRAARARVNAKDSIGFVVFVGEQVFQFELIELLLGGIDLCRDSLLRLPELDKHCGVGDFLVEGDLSVEFATNGGCFVEDRPGFGLIAPKGRGRHDVL